MVMVMMSRSFLFVALTTCSFVANEVTGFVSPLSPPPSSRLPVGDSRRRQDIVGIQKTTASTASRNPRHRLKALPSPAKTGVTLTDVLVPTYLASVMAYLTYQLDQDSDFFEKSFQNFRDDEDGLKSIFPNLAMIAFVGTSAPLVHVITCTAFGVTSTTTASAGGLVPWTEVAFPISLGLAIVYLSCEVDNDSDFVIKLLNQNKKETQASSTEEIIPAVQAVDKEEPSMDFAAVVKKEEDVDAGEAIGTRKIESSLIVNEKDVKYVDEEQREALTSEGTVLDDSLEMREELSAEKSLQSPTIKSKRATSLTTSFFSFLRYLYLPWLEIFLFRRRSASVEATSTSASSSSSGAKVARNTALLSLLRCLYFPWLDIVLDESNRRRTMALVQTLWFPWLPMILPSKRKIINESRIRI